MRHAGIIRTLSLLYCYPIGWMRIMRCIELSDVFIIKQQAGKKVVGDETRTSESKTDFKVFL